MRTENFKMYKLGLEKAEEPEIKLTTFIGSWRKRGSSRKTSASLTIQKVFDYVDHKLLKILKRWKYQTTLPVSREACMQVKKQQFELDMEQLTGSRLGRGTTRLHTAALLI